MGFLTALHLLILMLKLKLKMVEVALPFLLLNPEQGELDVRWGCLVHVAGGRQGGHGQGGTRGRHGGRGQGRHGDRGRGGTRNRDLDGGVLTPVHLAASVPPAEQAPQHHHDNDGDDCTAGKNQ